MSPILIAVCLSLTSAPGEEKGLDFPQKSNAPPATPRIPPTPSLQNRIDFFEKSIPLYFTNGESLENPPQAHHAAPHGVGQWKKR